MQMAMNPVVVRGVRFMLDLSVGGAVSYSDFSFIRAVNTLKGSEEKRLGFIFVENEISTLCVISTSVCVLSLYQSIKTKKNCSPLK